MNIRPWPFEDLPGGGLLDECELDSACARKVPVVLTRDQTEGMDDMGEYAQPPMPAEACSEIGAEQLTQRVRDDEAAFRRLLRRLGLLAIAAGSLGCAIYQVGVGHV